MTTMHHTTVLVVEDEALLLYSIADELRDHGFDVVEARNAAEALRALEANPEIRLLFTDVDMPGTMDGLALAAAVRHRWPPIKIIVTSGKGRPAPSALPDGAFIPKPYTSHAISEVFRRLGG
jgi:CheY-like chemotaxis protein